MDLSIDFNDTNVRIFLIPAVVSILAIGFLRITLGAWRTSVLAPVGIGVGFLVSYFLTTGLPLWPVASVLGITPYVVVAGILVGSFLDMRSTENSSLTLMHIALSMVLVFWVATQWHGGTIHENEMVLYGVLIFSGFWAMQQLNDQRDSGLAPAISIFSALVGIAIIANIYGTRTGLFASSLAAATIGYMVWNWPNCRYPWGSTGTIVGGGVYLILASELAIKNPALALPIGLTLLSFIIHNLTYRLFPTGNALQPFIQIMFSSLPIATAGYLVSRL